ncbi:MAG: ribosome maturation factor RimM [Muribaculaceae bacterium]|nr:ribosome maturation factor RimM [Muribaculaceae bacterium]
MIEEKSIISAGKFLKPHGLKGELNVLVEFDSAILEEDYPIIVDIDGIYVPFYAESVRPKGHFSSLVKLQGVDSQEEARPFVNKEFYLLRSDVAEFMDVDEDEIQTEDEFVGYKVYDKDHGYIGTVESVDSSTANLLLLVRPDGEDADIIYIPFDPDFITSVEEDRDTGECSMNLDLPDGLLDLNA